MNLLTKKLFFVTISAAIILTGCSKKPKRPDPSSTMIGPGGAPIEPSSVDGLNNPGTNLGGPNTAVGDQDRASLATETIYFDFDKSGIKTSERPKLQAAKKFLDEHADARLLLEGHCDWKGTSEYNLGLGDRRANAAKEYLATLGVSADKLETLSKGSLDAVEKADEATQAKDRRVELVVLKK